MRITQLKHVEMAIFSKYSSAIFVLLLLAPALFLRYSNSVALAQSALLIVLPIVTGWLVFEHARISDSYKSFTIHSSRLRRFSIRLLASSIILNVILTIGYGYIIGLAINEHLSILSALMFVLTAAVLTIAAFTLRLFLNPILCWIIVAIVILAGLPASSGVLYSSAVLHTLLPTTWLLSGLRFATYIVPAALILGICSFVFFLKALKRS